MKLDDALAATERWYDANGWTVFDFQREAWTAWHAGQSVFGDRERCNDFSIGIELEGTDTKPYTRVQYERLARISRQILLAYPAIKPENIVGHADIAPGRKTDPGECFDWPRYRQSIGIPG